MTHPSAVTETPVPALTIRLGVVEENTRAIVDRFDGAIVGVTKGVCGDPRVAGAMRRGGASALADSRLANLQRLDGIDRDHFLIRTPMRSEVDAVVRDTDLSMQSEQSILRTVGAAADRQDTHHRVILAVDSGDRREGVLPDDLPALLATATDFDSITVEGIATHVGSLNGVVPTTESLRRFVEAVERAEDAVGRRLPVLSAGSSNTLSLCFDGTLPERVTQLRIGEGILQGTDPVTGEVLPGLESDAAVLSAEVIECKRKPSAPDGSTGPTPFGETTTAADDGVRSRAILALGRVDVDVEGLTPVRDGIEIVGASSDHTVVDVTAAETPVHPGDRLAFRLSYSALVSSAASRYVNTAYDEREGDS